MKEFVCRFVLPLVLLVTLASPAICVAQEKQAESESDFSRVMFDSEDGLSITARLYLIDEKTGNEADANRPFIILCHQAGWSRGEYKEIAPKLNAMGFNCIAIDQRSGGKVNEVDNETAALAKKQKKDTGYIAAEQDIRATVKCVREGGYAEGKVILWGSSYSAALVLRIAGEHPDLVDGVLAFAPGEYFGRFDKPKDWIARSANNIKVPTFITSAKNECNNWSAIFEAIPGDTKTKFLPETEGNHGSRALWEQFDDSDDYWQATRVFLKPFLESSDENSDDQAAALPVLGIPDVDGLPSRIAFGSCGHQDKPQPILTTIVENQPDLFIYLGDNIYGDTKDMKLLQAKYDKLGIKPEFQRLRASVPVLSVWDDHDYGWNDAGKEYKFKAESKSIFMDFWQVPADSPRRQYEGIYGSHRFESDGHSLQVILLDTRTFRDSLALNRFPEGSAHANDFKNDYRPDPDPDKTLLGMKQWKWLEAVLQEPADLRIICSSIQFGHEYNGWESWTNLPAEQERMVQLIRDTRANGVVFISGDVHWGEISKRQFEELYPIYDVTASGLTEDWHNVESNRFRIGDAVRENHFGMVEIDWTREDPLVHFKIVDQPGTVRTRHKVLLSELQNPR